MPQHDPNGRELHEGDIYHFETGAVKQYHEVQQEFHAIGEGAIDRNKDRGAWHGDIPHEEVRGEEKNENGAMKYWTGNAWAVGDSNPPDGGGEQGPHDPGGGGGGGAGGGNGGEAPPRDHHEHDSHGPREPDVARGGA